MTMADTTFKEDAFAAKPESTSTGSPTTAPETAAIERAPTPPGTTPPTPMPTGAEGVSGTPTTHTPSEASANLPTPGLTQDAGQSNRPLVVTNSDAGQLDLVVFDMRGVSIPKLKMQVYRLADNNSRSLVTEGVTGRNGALPTIDGLKIGERFEVRIQTDAGDYKFAALGTLQGRVSTGNLVIPRMRFEFATYSHMGPPGTADAARVKRAKQHVQTPDAKVDFNRNDQKRPAVQVERTASGNPVAVITSGQVNMLGQTRLTTNSPQRTDTALDKVKALIEFGMQQLAVKHSDTNTSAVIIRKMKASAYQGSSRPRALGYAQSYHRCTKHVKIALWKAGYIPSDDDFAPSISAARALGPGLLDAGFAEITNQLPDARWAAPGDVIVYKRIGDDDAAGHIDIRTYDGYLSDFWDCYLPVSQFLVTGIYRKYYDPAPERRLRAFLKVIRSREASTIFTTLGDKETFRALPYLGKKGTTAPLTDSFAVHPFAGSQDSNNASGAYGIRKSTYKLYTDLRLAGGASAWVDVSQLKEKFSPTVQDRIAVAIMELHPGQGYGAAGYQTTSTTSLALVRLGKIEEAARQLATVKAQWTSLPGGTESRGYTMQEFLDDYQNFYAKL